MKQIEMDWGYLRPVLNRFGAAVLAAVLLYGGSRYGAGQVGSELVRQERRLREAREHYMDAAQTKRLLARFGERFRRYQAAGLIGEEQRLNWLEQLQAASRELKLPAMHYSLAPQGAVDAGAQMARYAVVAGSEMSLKVRLWHEGDLLALADRLRRNAQGLFWFRRCQLRRVADGQPTLEAECTLLWLTVRRASPDQRGPA